ncbi:MAG: hypothetical protein V4660_17825 [Pseudomonadota bacterium]
MKYTRVLVITLILGIVFLNIVFSGTEVVYISSDGKWSDREFLIKGHEFNDVVDSFEQYKIKCNTPDVFLERLKSRSSWFVLGTWIGDSKNIKLKVPLSVNSPYETYGFSLPPVKAPACYSSALTDEQSATARSLSIEYIASLQ